MTLFPRSARALHVSAALVPVVLGAAACDPARGVGDDPADQVKVADQPSLRHLEDALSSKGLSVGDLFRQRNLAFDRAPNPSAQLKQYQLDNDQRADIQGDALGVLTFNVALLRAEPFGIDYAESPHLDVRAESLLPLILSQGYDVVMLQEVWHKPNLDHFKNQAPRFGYTLVAQDRGEYTDGLVTLIRDAIRDTSVAPSMDHVPYTSQDPKEFWPGPSVKRGYLYVAFQHRTLGRIHTFNTHMQAFPDQWLGRMTQSRELGLRVAQEVPQGEVGIVAGDMNSGPYYRDDTWTGPNGRDTGDWWRNAVAWGLLGHYGGGMVDALAAGNEAQDVFLGNTVVNNWRTSTRIPGSSPGWCGGTPHVVFTASDCNTLYFQQYAGTEYPARLDHVWVKDGSGRVYVAGAGLEFTGRRTWPDGGEYEVSDHYAVGVNLVVRR